MRLRRQNPEFLPLLVRCFSSFTTPSLLLVKDSPVIKAQARPKNLAICLPFGGRVSVCKIAMIEKLSSPNEERDEFLPPAGKEFTTNMRLALTQEDSDAAVQALRDALGATKSQRTTTLSPIVVRGTVVYLTNGQPVMEPRDSYEEVEDAPTRIRAAEVLLAYCHGYPLKRSASIEATAFIPLDELLRQSRIFRDECLTGGFEVGARPPSADGGR